MQCYNQNNTIFGREFIMYEASKLLFCQYRKIFTVIILAIFFNFNLANQTSAYTASMSVVGGQNGISLDIPYTSSGMQKMKQNQKIFLNY